MVNVMEGDKTVSCKELHVNKIGHNEHDVSFDLVVVSNTSTPALRGN